MKEMLSEVDTINSYEFARNVTISFVLICHGILSGGVRFYFI